MLNLNLAKQIIASFFFLKLWKYVTIIYVLSGIHTILMNLAMLWSILMDVKRYDSCVTEAHIPVFYFLVYYLYREGIPIYVDGQVSNKTT